MDAKGSIACGVPALWYRGQVCIFKRAGIQHLCFSKVRVEDLHLAGTEIRSQQEPAHRVADDRRSFVYSTRASRRDRRIVHRQNARGPTGPSGNGAIFGNEDELAAAPSEMKPIPAIGGTGCLRGRTPSAHG